MPKKISQALVAKMNAEAKEDESLATKIENFDKQHESDHAEFVAELKGDAEAIKAAVKKLSSD